ncbi:uncharacterized protein ColSpa_06851 [Colletotrichum spaethianum]|uniref:Uncharacterized protein n=1 Tax=Colletotrichum spaethianum TaxID=700344 RepID=A0AA37P1F0_9PEZI|nr:uncharacterized protein ColSpa_06851 [Colletotrichum spaethianum]GKT46670.1 hypothetical protein ColSpa_06851 [Colletotrichum spaethianum]
MRISTFALIIFTLTSVALGAVVAVTVFRGESVENYAVSSSAVTTAITDMTYLHTTVTTTSVLEMNPLWTINTVKPDTIVINVRTDRPTTTTLASVDCKYKYCNSNTQYCTYWAGITGWDPSLGPIPGMTHTSLGSCQVPATDLTANSVVQTTMATKK